MNCRLGELFVRAPIFGPKEKENLASGPNWLFCTSLQSSEDAIAMDSFGVNIFLEEKVI